MTYTHNQLLKLTLLIMAPIIYKPHAKNISLVFPREQLEINTPEHHQYQYIKKYLDRYFATQGSCCAASELLSEIRSKNIPVVSEIKECPCSLFDRTKNPFRRGQMETALFELIKKRTDLLNKKAVVTFFGSGGLFQALAITTNLIEMGFSNLQINLIDRMYTPFFIENQPHFWEQIPGSDDGFGEPEYIQRVNFHPTTVPGEYTQTTEQTSEMLLQFLRWFYFIKKNHVPTLTLDCALYTCVNEYKIEIIQDKNTQSDILIATDVKMCRVENDLVTTHKDLLKSRGIYGYLVEGSFRELERCGASPISYIPERISQTTQMKLSLPVFTYVGIKQ